MGFPSLTSWIGTVKQSVNFLFILNFRHAEAKLKECFKLLSQNLDKI